MDYKNEYIISEYLLKHGDILREDILKTFRDYNTPQGKVAYTYFEDIILEEFIDKLQTKLVQSLNLTYVEADDIINRQFLKQLMGKEYLEINK